ncbi:MULTISPECIES: MurR/RpiR family transcriptional regulator [unclassified Romboutsia]|uniref:MurR/RpiR family transcriptional regulator n=1 Tax=unclassified Romboutsia TaxID=2626894 RepID=UPI0008230364|nr:MULTISPECIES: MurR/RpiR family transcriptional regulator [unclassified Romboutsia]SCI01363.1 Als operon repressor [uncultured Clostridium sp.]
MIKTFHVGRIFKNQNLSDSETKILEYIFTNPDKVKKEGIRQLAKSNFTSTASIIRLSKKLGYSGYNELIFDIKRMTSDSLTNNNEQENYFNWCSKIPLADLDELSKKYLNKKKYIYLYGEGFCEFVTGYIHRKLLVKKYNVILLHGLEIPIVYERDHSPTLIVVSKSGENFSCIRKIEQLSDLGGDIICITSNPNSSISLMSDVSLSIPVASIADSKNEEFTTFYGDSINLLEDLFSRV